MSEQYKLMEISVSIMASIVSAHIVGVNKIEQYVNRCHNNNRSIIVSEIYAQNFRHTRIFDGCVP